MKAKHFQAKKHIFSLPWPDVTSLLTYTTH